MTAFRDLTGKRFNRLTVLRRARNDATGSVWVCRCTCGTIRKYPARNLMKTKHATGGAKSCGCIRKGQPPLPRGEACLNLVFASAKRSAERRRHTFELTREQYVSLATSSCHYCGAKPRNVPAWMKRHSINGVRRTNGVDRKNPKHGYTLKNCVPCCQTCNYAKHSLTHAQFRRWVRRVSERL